MTIVDTIADAHYGDRVKMAMAFAGLLNEEARALAAEGVDVIQFDEPAFNVYMDEVEDWGIAALHRAIDGLTCTTAVHICYGYGIKANIDWKATLGGEWRQYEAIFPALAASRIDQVSLECRNAKVPVAAAVAARGQGRAGRRHRRRDRRRSRRPRRSPPPSATALKHVPKERIIACTNCGMAPMRRDIARPSSRRSARARRSRASGSDRRLQSLPKRLRPLPERARSICESKSGGRSNPLPNPPPSRGREQRQRLTSPVAPDSPLPPPSRAPDAG